MAFIAFDRWRHRASMRIRSLFDTGTLDRELDEELQYHLERSMEANIARGLSPEAARRAALVAIGGVEQRKEQCRDQRKVGLLDDLVRDLRYAARTLRRTPGFTTAAILTLMLGIGASVAMFTVVSGVLLRPLPFPEPGRLLLVAMSPRTPFIREPVLSDHNYVAFRAADRAFDHLSTFSTYDASLVGAGDPVVVTVAGVTTEFFDALRVAAAAGRTFGATDEQQGGEHVAVIGDRLWRERLNADPAALGRSVTIDGVRHSIVGIMPPGFDFPRKAQAWTPRIVTLDNRNSMMFPVFGRLKPRVTVAEARAQFDVVSRQLPHQPDGDRQSWTIGLIPLEEFLIGNSRRPLLILTGAVVCVLLIACANVANLLLARASGRQREFDIRAALGASRRRLIRQLFTESAFLAAIGGTLGLFFARWAVPAVLALAPDGRIPRVEMIRIDWWVVGFALSASLATALLFGLAPAYRIARRQAAGMSMFPVARTFGAGQDRMRAALVVGEIALALILLAGAGLMLKSFLRLRAVDPGFDTRNAVVMNLELPLPVYSSAGQLQAFHQDLLARLNALPDVASAGIVNWLPLGTMHLSGDFTVEGAPPTDFIVDKPAVSGGYFGAMGIRLIRGRDFAERDRGQGVAVVSRTVARVLDANEDAIGKRVSLETNPRPNDWLTVVGVVEDVRQYSPALPSRPAIYQPYWQQQRPGFLTHVSYVVRTTGDPSRAVPSLRTALRSVDANQPETSIVSMEDLLARSTAEPAFHARLLVGFAFVAVVLALVGTYGVLAYSVAQRTHEIGVRVAMGARASAIVWMVVRRTLTLSAAGVGLGTLGAWLATRSLATLLFETTPTDAVTFALVIATIFMATLAAGIIPARRATEVDPLVALRHD